MFTMQIYGYILNYTNVFQIIFIYFRAYILLCSEISYTFALEYDLNMLRVQELCKSKGVSMKDLAEKLGVTYQTLYANLSGNPTLSKLQAIAAALGVQVVDLFERPADESPTVVCPHCGIPIRIHFYK